MKQVYVHGLGQTPDSWNAVLQRMETTKESVCPNLARLLLSNEATYPNLYCSFAQFCDSLEGPLVLCGLSLGGVLALHYAAEHPERICALILIAPQYKMPKTLLRLQNIVFRFLPASVFQTTGFTKEQLIQLCSSMQKLDFCGVLDRITCPTLVICGSRDRANQKACVSLSRLLSQASLELIAGAGHELNQDAPETLAALLESFYAQIP